MLSIRILWLKKTMKFRFRILIVIFTIIVITYVYMTSIYKGHPLGKNHVDIETLFDIEKGLYISKQNSSTDLKKFSTHESEVNIALRHLHHPAITGANVQNKKVFAIKRNTSGPFAYFNSKVYYLKEDIQNYTKFFSKDLECYKNGTKYFETKEEVARHSQSICICEDGWHGEACSMPDIVFNSNYPYEYGVALKKPFPRRIIYGMPFSHELDLLEAKVSVLCDVVDVFLLGECNYTAAGKPRERLLLEKLEAGFLQECQHKIVYVPGEVFPRHGYVNGWAADQHLRDNLGDIGLKEMVTNVRDDDIFILTDVDELIEKDALIFLKLHYGYPEPFGFKLKHNTFGFFWEDKDVYSVIYGGCSIAMLHSLLQGSPYWIRSAPDFINEDVEIKDEYIHKGGRIRPWEFGTENEVAGWHCSWCFKPPGIVTKLLSAHANDYPRWGSIPGKTNVTYIDYLIRTGIWFDDTTNFTFKSSVDPQYAPKYILNKLEKFEYLLKLS